MVTEVVRDRPLYTCYCWRKEYRRAIGNIQIRSLEADPDRRLISFQHMRPAKWWMGSDRAHTMAEIFESEKTYKYFMSLEQQD